MITPSSFGRQRVVWPTDVGKYTHLLSVPEVYERNDGLLVQQGLILITRFTQQLTERQRGGGVRQLSQLNWKFKHCF